MWVIRVPSGHYTGYGTRKCGLSSDYVPLRLLLRARALDGNVIVIVYTVSECAHLILASCERKICRNSSKSSSSSPAVGPRGLMRTIAAHVRTLASVPDTQP